MITHKYSDKICCVILALTIVLTILFINAESFGIQKASSAPGYETRLFDTSKVHTVNIIMEDWDEFIESCTDEEYAECSVVIDNEAYKNVAIRAKGNTSLTNVKNYGNDRYSFKIEFDHYDGTKNYYGLDKLSLNNIIQDNTYMKDYLTYQMMGYFGVNAPLCSYVQILVNGEEWGLYLAVEGVEEAFLSRNYGNDYGNLYKPDSMSMGGGRGNGDKFDMGNWENDKDSENNTNKDNSQSTNTPTNMQGGNTPQQNDTAPNGMQGGPNRPEKMEFTIEQIKQIIGTLDDEALTSAAELLGYENKEAMLSALDNADDIDTFLNGKTIMDLMQLFRGQGGNMPSPNTQGGMNGGIGNGGRNSSDVSLIYSDDNYESYQNIFENAKTDITDADKDRLIVSLKELNENSSIEDIVNVEEVIRYFVVHNFVLNFDSYTGSMIHNYYLYEEDGQLSMIPWDYNLAFGGFVGGSDATSLVNFPIDTPVSGGTTESRPMLSWIFENEEYTKLYHQYFAEFITQYFDSGYFANMIDDVKAMISPYVESDPTKFCTYEEFEKGIDTLKEFCLLRAESINKQLDGTIAATSENQDKETFVDATSLTISDMGSMGGMGGGMDKPQGNGQAQMPDMQKPDTDTEQNDTMPQLPDNNNQNGTETQTPNDSSQDGMDKPQGNGQAQMPDMQKPDTDTEQKDTMPQLPDNNNQNGTETQMPNNSSQDGMQQFSNNGGNNNMQPPQNNGGMPDFPQGDNGQGMTPPENNSGQIENEQNVINTNSYIWLGISVAVLIAGLLFALLYKKRV